MPTARWRRSSTRPAGSLAAPRLRPRPWGGGPGQHGRTSAVGPARHWPGHRRAAAGACRRQPGAAGQRGCRRSAVGWPRARLLGWTDRHRRNRGDGHPNHGLWRIALVRRHCHEPTKLAGQRPTNKGWPSSTACAASSATSPARSTTTSSTNQTPHPLAKTGASRRNGCLAERSGTRAMRPAFRSSHRSSWLPVLAPGRPGRRRRLSQARPAPRPRPRRVDRR
jgi:hypothetical protein